MTAGVAVEARPLEVGRWGRGRRGVVAVHGMTMTRVVFHALADQLGDEFTVIAPDLRGRGRTGGGPPFGMEAHAEDVAALLAGLRCDDPVPELPVTVVGYSTGALVAALAARRRPDLVDHVVMVDGGFPPPSDPDSDGERDRRVEVVLARLGSTFPSTEAYLDQWRANPAIAGAWNGYLAELYADELVGSPPSLRPSLQAKALVQDAQSYALTEALERALRTLRVPVTLVRAARGMRDQDGPICSDGLVTRARALVPQLREVLIPDVNHHTILLTEAGARAVARIVRNAKELTCTTS